jgi:hypothetical protein
MGTDKRTIGISNSNHGGLVALVRAGHFGSELDAAKFAMAFAIRQGAAVGSTEGADTKWNVGSLDPDGSLRSLIETFYPDVPEPYRLAEHLMNEGIKSLVAILSESGDLYETLFPAPVTSR